MDELESQEFTLEDIMAEFSDHPESLVPQQEQQDSEEVSETHEEELISQLAKALEETEAVQPQEEAVPEMSSDTIRMDVIDIPETPDVVTADTVRIDLVSEVTEEQEQVTTGDTIRIAVVTEEPEEPEQVPAGDTIRIDEESLAAIHAATEQEEKPEEEWLR